MKYKQAANIFLVNPKKELLLQLRDDKLSISFPGYWSLFGGEINEGETALEAVKREINEEIGLTPRNIRFLEKIYVKKDKLNLEDAEISLFVGNIEIETTSITLNEGKEVRYFGISELGNIKLPDFYKKFIHKNIKRIL